MESKEGHTCKYFATWNCYDFCVGAVCVFLVCYCVIPYMMRKHCENMQQRNPAHAAHLAQGSQLSGDVSLEDAD